MLDVYKSPQALMPSILVEVSIVSNIAVCDVCSTEPWEFTAMLGAPFNFMRAHLSKTNLSICHFASSLCFL